MEKDQEASQEIPAPPYPGPPVNNIGFIETQPDLQPVQQPVHQQIPQQPVHQHIPQQPVHQHIPQQPVHQYIPQQPQFSTPVNQLVVAQPMPKDAPGQMVCPHCQNTVVTKIEYRNGLFTWLICGTLALIGCWPCFVIPFFVDACKDVEHSCPACNTVLHIHKPMNH